MPDEPLSGLSDAELEDLQKRIIDIVCRERPSRDEPLDSLTLYRMLTEEGTEPPAFAVSDALQGLRGFIYIGLGGSQNPHHDPEALVHGGVKITGFDPAICEA